MKPTTILLSLCLLWGVLTPLSAQSDTLTTLQSYDRHWEMQPGLYRVVKDGQTGVIKGDGKVIVPCRFDQVWIPNHSHYIRVLKDGKTGLYNLDKGLLLPAEYEQIWDFEEGLAKVMKNRRFGIINSDGLTVIPCEYTHIWARENNRFKVLKDGLIGYLAPDGTTIVPVIYQQIWPYHNHRARVLKEGKMGFIDESGSEIIPPIYDQAWDFENNEALVLSDGRQMIINPQGHLVEMAERERSSTTLSNETVIVSDTIEHNEPSKSRIHIDRNSIEINHKENTLHKKNNSIRNRFRAHLPGIGLAFNGYLNEDFKTQLPEEYDFMDPIQNKSVEFSLYPYQEDIALLGNWFGLAFGLGLQYNNYRLNLNSIDDIPEVGRAWFPEVSEEATFSKSKITTLFLNLPIMAELQIKNRYNKQPLYIAGGVVGGIKLKSHTKLVYYESDRRNKSKKRDALDISSLRYGFMAKAGFGDFSLYGTYYPTALFEDNKGPEIFPFSVGIMLNID